MNVRAPTAMCEFGEALSDLPQPEKVKWVRQLILDLMDYTEQSDDEVLWCELYDFLKQKYPEEQ